MTLKDDVVAVDFNDLMGFDGAGEATSVGVA